MMNCIFFKDCISFQIVRSKANWWEWENFDIVSLITSQAKFPEETTNVMVELWSIRKMHIKRLHIETDSQTLFKILPKMKVENQAHQSHLRDI